MDCREVGFDCQGVIHSETEEEALKLIAEHAQESMTFRTSRLKWLRRFLALCKTSDVLHAIASASS
ncbi:MAG: DUF1059 domain-containing protein [candidate division Zixibacteria bacterium]|nr:DUF1059 domain-containing protein [candidate division Zixibacteria bacterium]